MAEPIQITEQADLLNHAESLLEAGVIPEHTFKLIEKKILEKFKPEKPKNNWVSTFDKRKEQFKKSLYPYTKYDKNPDGIYPKEMMVEFFIYWSEANKSRSKMRWENETTWELNLRLARWANNNKTFSKSVSLDYDPEYEKTLKNNVEIQAYWAKLRSNGWEFIEGRGWRKKQE